MLKRAYDAERAALQPFEVDCEKARKALHSIRQEAIEQQEFSALREELSGFEDQKIARLAKSLESVGEMGLFEHSIARHLGSSFCYELELFFRKSLQSFYRRLGEYLSQKDEIGDAEIDIFIELKRNARFLQNLTVLGRPWLPVNSMAGQNNAFRLHRLFTEAVGRICAAEVQKLDAEDLLADKEPERNEPAP
jgi:hypothetical protein